MKFIAYALPVLILFVALDVNGLTVRYALIIGNNVGVNSGGKQPHPPLLHAEREATELKRKLVRLANFDKTNQRTKLLLGASSSDLIKAVNQIVHQMEKDRLTLDNPDTVFLFYFTGHGLTGELLLNDGPFTSTQLGDLFRKIDASLTLGVFDACYSGSLDSELLAQKGIRTTPGLNLFQELPKDILTAEGSIWFVSSGPQQTSYEDKQFGGVFTHFFIEALERAEADGPGITLDRIWHYTHQKTVEYTANRNREQSPQQFVAKLKTSAPVYFSFPSERNAILTLTESLAGHFMLVYSDGQMTEHIEKSSGDKLKLAVHSGPVRLMQVHNDGIDFQAAFSIHPNTEVVYKSPTDRFPSIPLGHSARELRVKGQAQSKGISATSLEPGTTVLLGPAYALTVHSPYAEELVVTKHGMEEPLVPRHGMLLGGRLDHGGYLASLFAGYAYSRHREDNWSWGYTSHSVLAEANVGYGWDVSRVRYSGALAFSLARTQQRFDDSTRRMTWFMRTAAKIGFLFTTHKPISLELSLFAGPARTPVISIHGDDSWHFTFGMGIAGYFRLF